LIETIRSPVGKLGVSVSDQPELANQFALWATEKPADQKGNAGANVLPLAIRTDQPASMRLPDDVLNSEVFGQLLDAYKQGHDVVRMTNYTTPAIEN
jgi:hypothetical protein